MDEKKPESAWDELVEDLGVEADPAATQRQQPQSTDLPSAQRSPEAEPPRSQPSDWNALAGSLGLEVTPPSPAPSDAQPRQDESPTKEPVAQEVELRDEPPEAADDTEGVSFDDLPELRSEFDKELIEASGDADLEDSEDSEDADGLDSGISGEAARTAFDSLFAEATSDWELPSSADNILDTPLEFSHTEDEPSLEAPEADPATSDKEATERPKRRRSRRGRRGRGGRSAEKKSEDASSTPEDTEATSLDATVESTQEESSDSEDAKSEKPRRRRSRRRGRRKASAVEGESPVENESPSSQPAAELNSDEEDEESDIRPSSRQRSSHRNLPTWSEAIGGIVDANLELRSKSPNKSTSSRGRGRGGRGRRKKQS